MLFLATSVRWRANERQQIVGLHSGIDWPVIFLFNTTLDGHGVVIIVNLIRDLRGHPEP